MFLDVNSKANNFTVTVTLAEITGLDLESGQIQVQGKEKLILTGKTVLITTPDI